MSCEVFEAQDISAAVRNRSCEVFVENSSFYKMTSGDNKMS